VRSEKLGRDVPGKGFPARWRVDLSLIARV
jgi:hypothetical protein